ncbi:hypothetical protein Vadar_013052 [Vaccinium darrowii]|uniref:Uncharacterized protein n=1 Tax=Vaccinium darrowii TaxID=229202 RepID=A0ACB7XQA7_9ERIC|nr:hypothetical protein Vadar_013052 [Vaccinium darrowii]
MEIPWKGVKPYAIVVALFCFSIQLCHCQDYDDSTPSPPPPGGTCNGIFVTYTFSEREKIFPLLKNASAQAWAFKSQARIRNSILLHRLGHFCTRTI